MKMITISACMIVKNEEKVLERCLKSLHNLVDELIVVDTGSTDNTKEIARKYTEHVYDYQWNDDFAEARNVSFSYATKEYIYVADADEVIDEENQRRFLKMKQTLLPEIEIVQMYYSNQKKFNTVYNFDMEYRPKLYRRLRTFQWNSAIHESVRLEPIIWDSDIVILHMPEGNHGKRDFRIYKNLVNKEKILSKKLTMMYARELFIAGENADFLEALAYFEKLYHSSCDHDTFQYAECVCARAYRVSRREKDFWKVCLKHVASGEAVSEICCEIGHYYKGEKEYEEAMLWYDCAKNESEPILDIRTKEEFPEICLQECRKIIEN